MMGCIIALAANAWTVNFTNPDGWSTVYVWAWTDSMAGEQFMGTGWPGQKMTNNSGTWTYTGSDTNGIPTHIIFNAGNGQPQTNDLGFQDGATYDKDGVVGAQKYTYTVYFENTDNWGEVYAYSWSPALAGGYPGTKLSLKAGSTNVYEWNIETTDTSAPDFSAGASNGGSTGFQFNNNSNGGTEKKTPNIYNFQAGATYLPDGSIKGEGPNYSGYYVNIIGEFDWENPGVQPDASTNIATLSNLKIGNTGFKAKIWTGSVDQYYIYSSEIPTGQWVTLTLGEESSPENQIVGATANSVYNIQYNVEKNQIFIDDVTDQNPGPSVTTLYIGAAELNDATKVWSAGTDNVMSYDEGDGTYTWSGTKLGGKFKIFSEDWKTYNVGAENEGSYITLSTPFTVVNNSESQDINIQDDAYISNPKVTFNVSALTVTVTGTIVTTAPYVPEVIYFKGTFDEWGDGVALKANEDGLYTGTVTIPASETTIEFKLDAGNDKWYGAVSTEANVTLVDGTATTLEISSGGKNWTLNSWAGGSVVATVDWDAKTLSLVGQTSSVERIENALNGEEVIYNLQGVRVSRENLKKGIYIINGKKTMVL